MPQPYTLTVWRVKAGREDDFVERWTEFAQWSARQGLTEPAKLLRDTEEPGRFLSFGPWTNMEAVSRWRSSREFDDLVRRLQEVLESFEPATLQLEREV